MAITVRVRGTDPPGLTCGPSKDKPEGYANIHCGLQRGQEVVARSPGDRPYETELTIEVRNGRFSGPYVHGRNGDRFLYLSWGEVDGDQFRMFRRAKLRLEHLDASALDGKVIELHLVLQDAKGHPVCASLRPPTVGWRVIS